MIIMLDHNTVIFATMLETQTAMSHLMAIPRGKLRAEIHLHEGKLQANFMVDPEATKNMDPDFISAVIQQVWVGRQRPLLVKRLLRVGDRRAP